MCNKKGSGGCSAELERYIWGRPKAALCFSDRLDSAKRVKTVSLLLVLVLLNLFSVACVGDVSDLSPTATQPWRGVSPVFREIYRYMGGEKVLGPAISDLMVENGLQVQYLTRGKLVYDRNAPDPRKFYFAPLARENGIQEPPLPLPQQLTPYYIEGHYVYEAFWPLYLELKRMADVGPPLTEVRYNPEHRRYEQFFAGLGFYHLEGSSEVHLLALGEWACDNRCRRIGVKDNILEDDIDIQPFIDPTFASFVARMGTGFTGFPLTEPYLSRDGTWKQIFENLVMIANSPNFVGSVRLNPMAKMLHVASEELRPASNSPGMIFYALDGDLGYDIPLYFWEYIHMHGGMDVIGPPITHYALLFNDGTYHQCFVNLCLMHNPLVNGGMLVRPEALGFAYKQLYFEQDQFQGNLAAPAGAIRLHVWEQYPTVNASQGQEIWVLVVENNLLRANASPMLILYLPDGSIKSLKMPLTGPDGKSSVRLGPIAARGSSMVSYEVCISEFGNDVCAGDSFLIWNNP